MKKLLVAFAAAAVIALSFTAAASAGDPPFGNDGDNCHGANQVDCRPDPQPSHGQDCDVHGNNPDGNDDHCAIPDPTPTPVPTPTPSATPSPSPDPTPTDTPLVTPTPSSTPTPTPTTGPTPITTPSPSEAPIVTLPPTDTVSTIAGPVNSTGLQLVIFGLVMIAIAAFAEAYRHRRQT